LGPGRDPAARLGRGTGGGQRRRGLRPGRLLSRRGHQALELARRECVLGRHARPRTPAQPPVLHADRVVLGAAERRVAVAAQLVGLAAAATEVERAASPGLGRAASVQRLLGAFAARPAGQAADVLAADAGRAATPAGLATAAADEVRAADRLVARAALLVVGADG